MKVLYWDEKSKQQKERDATPGEIQQMEAAARAAAQQKPAAPSGK